MLWPGRLKEIRFVWNSMDWQLLSTWKVWYNWYDFIKHSSNYFGTIMLMSNRASCSCVNLNVRVFISEFVSVNVVILALFIISHSRRWSVQMNIYTIMCHAQWRGSMKPLLRVTVENSVCWNTQEHSGTRRNTYTRDTALNVSESEISVQLILCVPKKNMAVMLECERPCIMNISSYDANLTMFISEPSAPGKHTVKCLWNEGMMLLKSAHDFRTFKAVCSFERQKTLARSLVATTFERR